MVINSKNLNLHRKTEYANNIETLHIIFIALFIFFNSRAPSLIVIDDVDSILASRDKTQNDSQKRLVATMLTLMDGINQVIILYKLKR